MPKEIYASFEFQEHLLAKIYFHDLAFLLQTDFAETDHALIQNGLRGLFFSISVNIQPRIRLKQLFGEGERSINIYSDFVSVYIHHCSVLLPWVIGNHFLDTLVQRK